MIKNLYFCQSELNCSTRSDVICPKIIHLPKVIEKFVNTKRMLYKHKRKHVRLEKESYALIAESFLSLTLYWNLLVPLTMWLLDTD